MGNRKNYGLPYQGSKNFIAKDIAKLLPRAENYYDLFCGGGAVLQAALETRKYKNYFANELNFLSYDGLKKAFNGEFKNEKRWISREDFQRLKDTDFYVCNCFSFGNTGKNYCYGKHIEPWKKALHYARVFNDFSLLREFGIETGDVSKISITKHSAEYKEKYINWYYENNNIDREKELKRIEQIKQNRKKDSEEIRLYLVDCLKKDGLTQAEVGRRLGNQMAGHYFGKSEWVFPTEENYKKMQEFMPSLTKNWKETAANFSDERLERLERLESLESLNKIGKTRNVEFFNKDYREIEIKRDSVVYLDPPYFNTEPYSINGVVNKFNHNEFYDWIEELAKREDVKIFISEYWMPPERFTKIKEFQKVSFMCSNALTRGQKTDNIYVPKNQDWADEEILPIFDNLLSFNL